MKQRQMERKLFLSMLPVLSIIILIGVWLLISSVNPIQLPPPSAVYERFLLLLEKPIKRTSLAGHIFASLKRVFTALVISWILGISFGVLIGWSKKCKAVLGSVFDIIRPIPPIAWIPLIIMWFGTTEFSKIVIVFIGTFTPVVLNTYAGIAHIDPIYKDVGKIFHGNQSQILLHVVLPTALPSIMAGLKTSVSSGWTVVLAAEMLGASSGVGFLVQRGWGGGDIPLVMVCIICIGIIGAMLAWVLNIAERWLCPWTRTSD